VEYGPELIAGLPAENIIADKGYDSDAFVRSFAASSRFSGIIIDK
jgi:hypothetical protein